MATSRARAVAAAPRMDLATSQPFIPGVVGFASKFQNELAAATGTFAARLHCPTVQFDQALDEGQSNSQSAVRAVQPPVRLSEEVENTRQEIGRNSHAGVPHRNPRS